MSERGREQIKADIHRVLLEVAKRFEEDPTPTDGSFQAALEKMGMKAKPDARKKAIGKKRPGRR